MILNKIQHYLRLVFLVSLVIVQTLVFVGTRASSNSDYSLTAVWLDPVIGHDIVIGELINLQAVLHSDEADDFSVVYFNISNQTYEVDLDFAAQLMDDGSWLAPGSWDTNLWSPGVYTLSATAHVYDEEGLLIDSYNSADQLVNLVSVDEPEFEPAFAVIGSLAIILPETGTVFGADSYLDIRAEGPESLDQVWFLLVNVYDNDWEYPLIPASCDWAGGPLAQIFVCMAEVDLADETQFPDGTYGIGATAQSEQGNMPADLVPTSFIIDRSTINDPDPEPVSLGEFNVFSPESDDNVSGIIDVMVGIEFETGQPDLQMPEEVYAALAIVDPAETVANLTLHTDLDFVVPGFATFSAELNSAEFNDGSYLLAFSVPNQGGSIEGIGEPVYFTIGNNEPELEPELEVTLDQPIPGSTITTDSFQVEISTNIEVEGLSFELINQNEPTIGFVPLDIPTTDGYTWAGTVVLGDHFIDGSYILKVTIEPSGEEFDFNLVLERGSSIIPEPVDINLTLHVADTNLNEDSVIYISANVLGPQLIFEDTVSGETLPPMEANIIECDHSVIPTEVQAEFANSGNPYCFYKNLVGDSGSILSNGNYYLYLEAPTSDPDTPMVQGERVLISFFDSSQVEEGDIILRWHDLRPVQRTEGRRIQIPISTSDILTSVDLNMYSEDDVLTEDYFNMSVYQSRWEYWQNFGIDQENNLDTPHIYTFWADLSRERYNYLEDGRYYIILEYKENPYEPPLATSDKYYFSVLDGRLENWQDYEGAEINEDYYQSPEDVLIRLYDVYTQVEDDNLYKLYFSSDIDIADYGFVGQRLLIFNSQNDQEVYNSIASIDTTWNNFTDLGILSSDNEDVPYPRLASAQDLEDGQYYAYIEAVNQYYNEVIGQSNQVEFTVENGLIVSMSSDDPNEPPPPPPSDAGGVASDMVIPLHTSCLEAGITDEEACLMFRATLDLLDDSCITAHIYEPQSCEQYLYRTQVDQACQTEGIVDPEECKDYLLEKYGSQVDCQLVDAGMCNDILRNEYLNRLVAGQIEQGKIEEVVNPLIGQVISTEELDQKLKASGVTEEVLPTEPSYDTKVLLAKAQSEIVLEGRDRLTIIGQAVIIVDTDGDGLTDDLEIYYGTDINNPDTDGDSYPDGTEVKNNYSPIGPGRLEMDRLAFDQAILEEAVLEQPKILSNKVDKKYNIKDVTNLEDNKVTLSGQAEPDTWVTLYLYSDLPLVMTTKTDASGNWSYDIKHSLTDGHHRVYVTVNDSTGKIIKQSSPVSFLVKKAQAVTAEDYFDTNTGEDTVRNMLVYYILGGLFLVFLALGIIIFIHGRRNSDQEIELES